MIVLDVELNSLSIDTSFNSVHRVKNAIFGLNTGFYGPAPVLHLMQIRF